MLGMEVEPDVRDHNHEVAGPTSSGRTDLNVQLERVLGPNYGIVMEGEVDQRQFFLRLLHQRRTAFSMNASGLLIFELFQEQLRNLLGFRTLPKVGVCSIGRSF
jgi:hypothetical protein